ncbi:PKD domain-containing protein [Streptomyces sp. WM6372]|uniref:PKD domain-containing protein n=1 Tax=Streptomyces sp. WM6372 TaxID=1415555 RepID=UPI000AFB3329|nr:PKD domain-containing protein [Streptomyces sp. WM6372]
MRPTRTVVLLAAGLVTLFGVPGAAAADTPASLYVDNADAHCSDAGSGAQAAPFCTISAAVRIVKPGQTVRIAPGEPYDEALTIDRSGEPGRPIAFVSGAADGYGRVDLAKGLTVSGAGHVVVRGMYIGDGIRVSRSTDIELDRIDSGGGELDGLVVGEASADVRFTRSSVWGVRIEGGARGTVLSRNELNGTLGSSNVAVVDAPGTVITNNDFSALCGATVSFSGASTGSALFNNVIFSESTHSSCRSAGPRGGLDVSQSAAEGTRVDYNVFSGHGTPAVNPYTWAGKAYPGPAAFQAATGQGAHDLLAPDGYKVGPIDGSPTVDSADPTAPGVLPSDKAGKPTADDPRVPNTGKDGGYLDRGAYETQDQLRGVRLDLDQYWAPVGTTVKATADPDNRWPGALTYHYDFGDGTAPVVTRANTAEHVYGAPCEWCRVTVTAVSGNGQTASAGLSTNVTPAGPLTAALTVNPELPTSDSPISHAGPLSVGVDLSASAAPWPVQSVDFDFGDGTTGQQTSLSGTSHAYARPGEYKVTVTVRDTKGATSTATRSVKVDYAPSGYVATAPFRLLDTRSNGTVLRGGSPTAVTLPVGLSVPDHVLSGSMAAAVLNVTVTGASEDTHLSVWPSGQPRPATSNVNVRKGGTSSNTVTVPVGADGKVSAQLNSGSAALVVDFVGYYQPGIGQRFSPIAPTRLADTRAAGGALGGGQTRTVKVAGTGGIPADATAVALNLTGTGSTENAHVIAYPDPAKRPATSNLNLEPGKDKSNQAIVPVGPDGTITLYTNTGSTHLILDAVGWYGKDGKALFTPTVPRRLADTRATGKLAPGATTTVTGLPVGAVGVALNVTATDSTGPGFLTVYGYGTARPEASSLNTRPGDTVPNHVTTPVADGRVSISNSYGGSTHVITDLLGYFTQP